MTMATPRAIDRSSFRVFRTNDGRSLLEHPQRIDKDGNEPSLMLVVSDAAISVQDRKQAYPTSSNAIVSSHEIMGLIGILELAHGRYLIGVSARTLTATIQSHKIWRITAGIAIPAGSTAFPARIDSLNDAALAKYAVDRELLSSIMTIVNSGHLYYSTSYDLTHSVQHNYLSRAAKSTQTVIDDRYFFNRFLQSPLIDAPKQPKADPSPWIAKVIAGFTGSIDIDCNLDSGAISAAAAAAAGGGVKATGTTGNTAAAAMGKARTYTVVLVSRLNYRRLGTRYIRRGLDLAGNAANNVEMEQIVFNHDFLRDKSISSYVQLRGSAPAIWGQEIDLSYRPRLILADANKEDIWAPIKQHYQDLKCQYIGEKSVTSGSDHGQVVCVNLLDDTGFEGPLTAVFERTVKRFNDPKLTYEPFPMNKWCKKMNYKNMDILLDRVRIRLINSGWFVADGEVPSFSSTGSLRCSKIQTGVARVSCLDSLDRTNLTCSIFARYVLAFQVQAISPDLPAVQVLPVTGVSPSEVRDPAAAVRRALELGIPALTNLWADSGDAVSLLYAGTRALKADVTRTGKRQLVKGSLDDGINALTRYYLNNFADGNKQDGYDIWTGKTSHSKITEIVETHGRVLANRLRNPIVNRKSGAGMYIPSPIIGMVEPLVIQAREYKAKPVTNGKPTSSITPTDKRKHLDDQGIPHTYPGLIITLFKAYAPNQITNVFEFVFAMVVFFYVFIFVKVLKIKGQTVVNKPMFSSETAELKQIAA